ncbi:hypothetical protein MMC25_007287 [Agyrium rufum]|nr:hypothetical protein [Agyrium rufum]
MNLNVDFQDAASTKTWPRLDHGAGSRGRYGYAPPGQRSSLHPYLNPESSRTSLSTLDNSMGQGQMACESIQRFAQESLDPYSPLRCWGGEGVSAGKTHGTPFQGRDGNIISIDASNSGQISTPSIHDLTFQKRPMDYSDSLKLPPQGNEQGYQGLVGPLSDSGVGGCSVSTASIQTPAIHPPDWSSLLLTSTKHIDNNHDLYSNHPVGTTAKGSMRSGDDMASATASTTFIADHAQESKEQSQARPKPPHQRSSRSASQISRRSRKNRTAQILADHRSEFILPPPPSSLPSTHVTNFGPDLEMRQCFETTEPQAGPNSVIPFIFSNNMGSNLWKPQAINHSQQTESKTRDARNLEGNGYFGTTPDQGFKAEPPASTRARLTLKSQQQDQQPHGSQNGWNFRPSGDRLGSGDDHSTRNTEAETKRLIWTSAHSISSKYLRLVTRNNISPEELQTILVEDLSTVLDNLVANKGLLSRPTEVCKCPDCGIIKKRHCDLKFDHIDEHFNEKKTIGDWYYMDTNIPKKDLKKEREYSPTKEHGKKGKRQDENSSDGDEDSERSDLDEDDDDSPRNGDRPIVPPSKNGPRFSVPHTDTNEAMPASKTKWDQQWGSNLRAMQNSYNNHTTNANITVPDASQAPDVRYYVDPATNPWKHVTVQGGSSRTVDVPQQAVNSSWYCVSDSGANPSFYA